MWLHEVGKERRMVSGVERVVGVNIRAQNKKNKIGEPFHTVDVLIAFNYGVDDELSMIEWLKKNKGKSEVTLSIPLESYTMAVRRAREKKDTEALTKYHSELRAATQGRWLEIEDARRTQYAVPKYGAVS